MPDYNDPDYDKYEKNIEDIDELPGTDININPDYYIHGVLLKAQQALINPDAKSGFLQFSILIEHMESLCIAAKILPENYDEKIKTFRETEEYKKEDDKFIAQVKVANYKLKLLMEKVFSAKLSTTPLKV